MNAQGNSGRALMPRLLGVVVPLACGLAYFPVIGPISEAIGPTVGTAGVIVVQVGLLLVVGALGALLLQTWMAPFIVLPSFIVGLLAVQVINFLQPGAGAGARIYPEDLVFLLAFVVLAMVPLAVGAVLALAGDAWRQRRRAARQPRPFPQTAPLIPPREEREHEPMTSR